MTPGEPDWRQHVRDPELGFLARATLVLALVEAVLVVALAGSGVLAFALVLPLVPFFLAWAVWRAGDPGERVELRADMGIEAARRVVEDRLDWDHQWEGDVAVIRARNMAMFGGRDVRVGLRGGDGRTTVMVWPVMEGNADYGRLVEGLAEALE